MTARPADAEKLKQAKEKTLRKWFVHSHRVFLFSVHLASVSIFRNTFFMLLCHMAGIFYIFLTHNQVILAKRSTALVKLAMV